MEFKDDEFFIYKERSFPTTRDPRKNPLEKVVYPWRYAITGNTINKADFTLSRIINKDKDSLIEEFVNKLGNGLNTFTLLTNHYYQGDFVTEGVHADMWIHQEKGVGDDVLRYFAEKFKEKGVAVKTKETSISVRYFNKDC